MKLDSRNKKQRRDCDNCIAYCNMLGGLDNRCGLGFRVVDEVETDELQQWHCYLRPFEDECEAVPQPETKEEFIEIARQLGIEWKPDEVYDLKDLEIDWR